MGGRLVWSGDLFVETELAQVDLNLATHQNLADLLQFNQGQTNVHPLCNISKCSLSFYAHTLNLLHNELT
jgi:hypothetical protein